MKLILTAEVDALGQPGDIVVVKDGYGRNYLLPRKFAIAWTRGGEKQITAIKRAQEARAIRGLDHANEVKVKLEGAPVRLTVRAGEAGKLFGSVTTGDVIAAIRAAGGPALDKRSLTLSSSIKSVGQYQLTVRLHPEVQATVSLDVVAA